MSVQSAGTDIEGARAGVTAEVTCWHPLPFSRADTLPCRPFSTWPGFHFKRRPWMNSPLSTSPLLSQILPAAASSVLSVKTVCAFAFIVFHNKHCMYLMNVLCCACLQRLLTGWELVSSPIEAPPVSMEMRLLQTHRFLLSASCPLPRTSLP